MTKIPGLALVLAVVAAGPAAGVKVCPIPDLGGAQGMEDAEAIGRSRDAVAKYQECLAEHAEVLELLDSDAASRLALQHDVAERLKRTLDAWMQARLAATERRPRL